MKYLAAAGLCVALGGAGVALAQGNQPTTRAEAKARADARFDALDRNKDGFIAADELPAMRGDRWSRHGRGMGRMGPGRAFAMRGPGGRMPPPGPGPMPDKAALDRLFEQMDSDKNGQVSRAEFDAFHAAMVTARQTERPMMRGGPGLPPPPGAMPPRGAGAPPMPGPGGGPMPMRGMMLERIDTNHDGKISRAEMEAAALARFDAADTNHDGKLSDAERQAARARDWAARNPLPPTG